MGLKGFVNIDGVLIGKASIPNLIEVAKGYPIVTYVENDVATEEHKNSVRKIFNAINEEQDVVLMNVDGALYPAVKDDTSIVSYIFRDAENILRYDKYIITCVEDNVTFSISTNGIYNHVVTDDIGRWLSSIIGNDEGKTIRDISNEVVLEVISDWARSSTKPKYTASEVGADEKGTADNVVLEHNKSADSHDDIRELISAISSKLNALCDSDDNTLDQLSEIVAYIQNNKSLIDNITTSKVSVNDVIDTLNSSETSKPISAKQGKVLKELIDAIVIPTELSEMNEDSSHRLVTDSEKRAWDNKSEFSGSYRDLRDKPEIKNGISPHIGENGHWYVGEVDTGVKAKDDTAVKMIIVETLPDVGEANTIYLVPKSDPKEHNRYDEYIYSDDNWTPIVDAVFDIDFSEYIKRTDYAGTNKYGVVKSTGANGIDIDHDGSVKISRALAQDILMKHDEFKPITPSTIDYAVKMGLLSNSIDLTMEEKNGIQTWLGIKVRSYQTPSVTVPYSSSVTVPVGIETPIGELQGDITITLGAEEQGYSNEWDFIIKQPSTKYNVTLPDISWRFGSSPSFAPNTSTYVRLYKLDGILKGVWDNR